MRNFLFALLCLFATSLQANDNVVVVLDNSGSMDTRFQNTTRMEAAKNALHTVLRNVKPDTNVGIVLLNPVQLPNGKVTNWIVPFEKVNQSTLHPTIDSIKAFDRTPLGTAMKAGTDVLLNARKQQKYGTYRLLVVTDGEATDGNLVDVYTPDIMSRNIRLEVIGLDLTNHSLSKMVHSYRSASDQAALTQAVSKIFAETTNNDGNVDYEIIAGIPSDLSKEIAVALGKDNNEEIGQKRELKLNQVNQNQPAATEDSGVSLGVVFTIVFVGLVIIVFSAIAASH